MGRIGWGIVLGCILGVILFGILQRGCSATAEKPAADTTTIASSKEPGVTGSPQPRPQPGAELDALGNPKPKPYERRPGPSAPAALAIDAANAEALYGKAAKTAPLRVNNTPAANPVRTPPAGTVNSIAGSPRPVPAASQMARRPGMGSNGVPLGGTSGGFTPANSGVIAAPAFAPQAFDSPSLGPGFVQTAPGVFNAINSPTPVNGASSGGAGGIGGVFSPLPNTPSSGGGSSSSAGGGLTTVTGGTVTPNPTTTAAPADFALLTPATNSTGVAAGVTFTWQASARATTYRLRVSTSSAFASTLIDQQGLTSPTFTAPANALAAGQTYFWIVTAQNTTGSKDAGAAFSFTTASSTTPPPTPPPTGSAPGLFDLQTPADATRGLTGAISFLWAPSTNAASYTLDIARDPGFVQSILSARGLTTAFLVVPAQFFQTGAQYYWRVTAVNTAGTRVSNQPSRTFSTLGKPGQFDLVAPADTTSNAAVPVLLLWGSSLDAAQYRVEVATDTAFTNRVVNSTVTANGLTLTAADGIRGGTTYYWRVTASNALDFTGSSSTRSFTTQQGPGDFALVSPAAGGSACLPLRLSWAESDRALTYRVEISIVPSFATTVLSQIVVPLLSGTSLRVPDGVLRVGQTYYWRVTASNLAGDTPSLGAPASFSVTTANFDVNADGVVDVRDLYAYESLGGNRPDLTCDGVSDDTDRLALRDAVRANEMLAITARGPAR